MSRAWALITCWRSPAGQYDGRTRRGCSDVWRGNYVSNRVETMLEWNAQNAREWGDMQYAEEMLGNATT